MLQILFVGFPAEGHVNPTLGLVQAFTERGDQVHYITTEHYKERIEAVGATVHLHDDLIRMAKVSVGSVEGVKQFLNLHAQISLAILDLADQLKQTIHFDVIIFDKFGAGELVSEYLNVPGISSSASFLIPNNAMAEKIFKDKDASLFEPDQPMKDSLSQIQQKYGVSPKHPFQFMNNKAPLTIVYTSKYFQPNNAMFDDTSIFIGPSFPERVGHSDFPLERLEGQQVLYISMGTVLHQVEHFFNACIEAFADFDGIVVIAAGEKADLSKLHPAPDHFMIAPYVPQLKVLNLADVTITHGGMNSVNEAIHFNVPMVILPQDKDQPMVAQRLVELEAAYRITKDQINVESLRMGVHEVLSNPAYKENVKKINASFQQSGGPAEALTRIDEFLKIKSL
ncbi:macrolide family glycosyltransferase [Paenibacillus wenxiniae]|uniref:Macrolide family glycosyltransferase n=1 Tax=Paenibacillus wenxiniae TaxID=1636843 RepID=A0ABW4RIF1_9BACL